MRPYLDYRDPAPSSPSMPSPKSLHLEGLTLKDLAGQTPVYVTSLTACKDRAMAYQNALKSHFKNTKCYFAVKANPAPEIIQTFLEMGLGFDIVSEGELDRVLGVSGTLAKDICFAGVGKTKSQIEKALRLNVGWLNVEHPEELHITLEKLMDSAYSTSTTQLAIRLNPCVEVATHPHLKTGALNSKFGILRPQLLEMLEKWKLNNSPLFETAQKRIRGIHVHVGSQLSEPHIYESVVKETLETCECLEKLGLEVRHLDFGGGLEVPFQGIPQDHSDIRLRVDTLAQYLVSSLPRFPILREKFGESFDKVTISIEPGRSLVASSTVLVTQVLYTKSNDSEHHFAVVDAGMNDFPRPSLYGAKHEILPVQESSSSHQKQYIVCGPVCESGDVFDTKVALPELRPGDLLAFLEAGAYCYSMASQYNLRPLPVCLFVKDSQVVGKKSPVFPA
jgi:diaminopimelate decarboxylase